MGFLTDLIENICNNDRQNPDSSLMKSLHESAMVVKMGIVDIKLNPTKDNLEYPAS